MEGRRRSSRSRNSGGKGEEDVEVRMSFRSPPTPEEDDDENEGLLPNPFHSSFSGGMMTRRRDVGQGGTSGKKEQAAAVTFHRSPTKKRRHEEGREEEKDERMEVDDEHQHSGSRSSSLSCPLSEEEERDRLHSQADKVITEVVEELEKGWNIRMKEQVEEFMRKGREEILKGGGVVPVAFIPSSSSIDEDRQTFISIQEEIRSSSSSSSPVVRLVANKCPSVRSAFQNLCLQLQGGMEGSTTPQELKQKMKKDGDETDFIVVLIENAHHFQGNVVSQFIRLLTSASLSCIFIIGVMGCGSRELGRFIPSDSSSAFIYSTFESVGVNERLKELLYKILDPSIWPIFLSGRIIHYLSKYYKNQHTSTKRLLQGLKLCMLEHYRKPESILCNIPATSTEHGGEGVNTKKSALPSKAIALKKYDELAASAKLRGISKGSDFLMSIVEGWERLVNWNFSLKIISSVQGSLLGTDPEQVFLDLYISISTGTFFQVRCGSVESPFDRFFTEVKNLTKGQLNRVLTQLWKDVGNTTKDFGRGKSDAFLCHSKVPEIMAVLKKLKDDQDTLEDRVKQMEKENSTPPGGARKESPSTSSSNTPKLRKGIKGREELKALLKCQIDNSRCTAASKPFQELKQSFINFLKEVLFKEYLKPVGKLMKGTHLEEAFIFDDFDCLKNLFAPDPCSYISNSLALPGTVLECKCCSSLGACETSASLPDTSLVFKLLKEQTHKKVDLNALYYAFSEIAEQEEVHNTTKSGRPSKNKFKIEKPDKDSIILRFRQAVAELQFIGALKRSKKNPDEITKLIWI